MLPGSAVGKHRGLLPERQPGHDESQRHGNGPGEPVSHPGQTATQKQQHPDNCKYSDAGARAEEIETGGAEPGVQAPVNAERRDPNQAEERIVSAEPFRGELADAGDEQPKETGQTKHSEIVIKEFPGPVTGSEIGVPQPGHETDPVICGRNEPVDGPQGVNRKVAHVPHQGVPARVVRELPGIGGVGREEEEGKRAEEKH